MEIPKKPVKKTSATTGPAKKTEDTSTSKPKNKFIDDDDEDEFDNSMDDELGSYDQFDGLEEDDDY